MDAWLVDVYTLPVINKTICCKLVLEWGVLFSHPYDTSIR